MTWRKTTKLIVVEWQGGTLVWKWDTLEKKITNVKTDYSEFKVYKIK